MPEFDATNAELKMLCDENEWLKSQLETLSPATIDVIRESLQALKLTYETLDFARRRPAQWEDLQRAVKEFDEAFPETEK